MEKLLLEKPIYTELGHSKSEQDSRGRGKRPRSSEKSLVTSPKDQSLLRKR